MAKVLLIEDEENIRKIISYDLRKAGHTIVESGDGQEALDIALKQPFDVLIIDWMLPHVSGIEIVQKLRTQHVDSVMIMLTARDDETDIPVSYTHLKQIDFSSSIFCIVLNRCIRFHTYSGVRGRKLIILSSSIIILLLA